MEGAERAPFGEGGSGPMRGKLSGSLGTGRENNGIKEVEYKKDVESEIADEEMGSEGCNKQIKLYIKGLLDYAIL